MGIRVLYTVCSSSIFTTKSAVVFGFLDATIMQSKTLISTLVFWAALLCFTRVASDDTSEPQHPSLAEKLNMLVHHSGWRSLENVKIAKGKDKNRTFQDPMSEILETISSGRVPVDESNVTDRYQEIWTVLRCKYAEVIITYRTFVQHLIKVCRYEKSFDCSKTSDCSLQKYYDCFRLLLIKLHSMSARFKCMTDALELMHSLNPNWRPKNSILVGTQKLYDYTLTVGPSTSSKLTEQGMDEEAVDLEIKTISDYFLDIYMNHVKWYASRRCHIPPYSKNWSTLMNNYTNYKTSKQLIQEEPTLLQYVLDEMDCYVTDIFDNCFYKLGFAYDGTGNVMIGIN